LNFLPQEHDTEIIATTTGRKRPSFDRNFEQRAWKERDLIPPSLRHHEEYTRGKPVTVSS
jgi:hypothetical protein